MDKRGKRKSLGMQQIKFLTNLMCHPLQIQVKTERCEVEHFETSSLTIIYLSGKKRYNKNEWKSADLKTENQ